MTFCRSCQFVAGFQLMAAFSDCVNFMTTHCSVFFSSTVSVSIVLFMHYMIKKFPVSLVWICFKFQSRFFPTESSQAKNFGFLLLSCEKFCYTFWRQKAFDRTCWRKLLLNRFFQRNLKIIWNRSESTGTQDLYLYNILKPNQGVELEKIEKIFQMNSLLSFSIYCEQMEIVSDYAIFRLTYLFSNGIFHPKLPKFSITGEIHPWHSVHQQL